MMGLLAVFVLPEVRTRTFREKPTAPFRDRSVRCHSTSEKQKITVFRCESGARNVAHVIEREKLRP